jgi:predicted O-methyltransferase YrrM
MYYTFNDIIENVNKSCPVKLQLHSYKIHGGICLQSHELPVSINEPEFNYMKDFIIKHCLKTGVELATGTGISALSIGLGMKETGGSLMSMDAYLEEQTQQQPIHTTGKSVYMNSNCYIVATYMKELYNLQGIVNFKIGLSPHDLKKEIENLNSKVDFVFLDCPKDDDDYERDIRAIYPYLSDKYAIFIHDTHTYKGYADKINMELFGKTFTKIHKYYEGTEHEIIKFWPMALITNLDL